MEILDKGESAAIALALEKNMNFILIDERKGKHIAQRYGIESTGTLGILIKAKQSGLLKEIKPDLLKLKNDFNFLDFREFNVGYSQSYQRIILFFDCNFAKCVKLFCRI